MSLSFLLTHCIVQEAVPTLPPIHVHREPLSVTEFRILTDANK